MEKPLECVDIQRQISDSKVYNYPIYNITDVYIK